MRKVTLPILAGIGLVATVALSGAAVLAQDAEPQRGGRLELVALNDLAHLDNHQAVNTIDYNMVAGALYEGLYHFTPDGELEPGLADGMPEVSEDGLVYTIRLTPGAMFAGPDFEPREVTAADVAYGSRARSTRRPAGAAAQSWGAGYLFPIVGATAFSACARRPKARRGDPAAVELPEAGVEGIEVVDDHTLQVTLTQPSVTFLLRAHDRDELARAAGGRRGARRGLQERPVGAGPFFVQEWNRGADITLARNPGYVDPELPYLDEIHVDLGVDENTQVLRIESGEADGVFEQFSISPASLRLLAQNPDVTVSRVGRSAHLLPRPQQRRHLRGQGPAPGGRAGDDDRLHGPVRRPREALEPAHELDDRAVRPRGHDDLRARSGGRRGPPRVGRLRRHAGQDRLRRDRPVHVGQLHGARAGPRGGRLHGRPARPPEGASSSATAASTTATTTTSRRPTGAPTTRTRRTTSRRTSSAATIPFLNISHFCDEDIDAALFAHRGDALRPRARRGAARRPAAAHRRGGGRAGHGGHAAGRRRARASATCPRWSPMQPYDWKRAWVKAEG